MHPLPISEVKAILKQTPKLGAHHIVLIQTNGLTLGPFYFRSGGVRALFSCLKQASHMCCSLLLHASCCEIHYACKIIVPLPSFMVGQIIRKRASLGSYKWIGV